MVQDNDICHTKEVIQCQHVVEDSFDSAAVSTKHEDFYGLHLD